MKELSIEEKAKRYDEAIKKLRSLHDDYDTVSTLIDIKKELENIFPELKESKDERMRNAAINACKYMVDNFENSTKQYEDAIAWLEKQGETFTKKDVDDAYLKGVCDAKQELEKQGEQKPNYCHHEVDLSECSEEYLKAYYDGWNNCNMQHSQCKSELDDVVKCLINGMKFYYEDNEKATWGTDKWSMPVKHIIEVLERQCEQNPTIEMKSAEESLGIDSDTYNKIVDECIYGEQKPIDADLKDIVDKEANAIWKEINTGSSYSIIDSFNQFYGICWQVAGAVVDCKKPTEWIQELESKLSNATPEQLAEWKEKYFKVEPAWSEEDKKMSRFIGNAITADGASEYLESKGIQVIDAHVWLDELKDKVQPRQEWSEDDKNFMCDTLSNLTELKDRYGEGYGNVGKCIGWLESIKDRVQPQPKQAWSEKDEVALDDALWCCKQAASIAKDENDMGNVWYAENWLKSIKDKYTSL